MGRKSDQFWNYAEDLNGCFKCNFCKRDFSGGVSSIKSHLAGVKGHDIDMCEAVPESVQKEAYQATQVTNKNLKSASTSNSNVESETSSNSISTIQKDKIGTQSMEEYMADIILDDVVDRLATNAISLATEHKVFEWSMKEELKIFLDKLYKIKVVLHDAQKRQVSDESVKFWLMELRDVAYEADNVLGEFGHEILRQKAQIQNPMIDQVCGFPLCNLDRVKTINQSFGKIVNAVVGFGLRMDFVNSTNKIVLDKNLDSFLDDSEVVGSAYDVVKIVNLLTSSSNQHVLSILPIVGMAGLGKSTLAKLVYNHELVKKHFDVLVWVHASKNFNVTGILREILKSLNEDLIGLEDDEILQELLKRLRGKKYLLVLDDVCNEDHEEWNTLRRHLLGINSITGNNIIVTTCSNNVAQIMGTINPYCLEQLSKDE